MQSLAKEDVLTALSRVVDPDKNNKDVVALGLVQGLAVKDGHVSFALEVAPDEGHSKEPLRLACEKAVLGLNGARSVTAVLTAHRAGAYQQCPRLDYRAHFADGEQRFHAMVSRHFARS